MTGWHVDEETLRLYARGQGQLSFGASVEAHLISCARCRALLTPAVDVDRLERLWDEVVERVDAPRPGVVERLLRLARIPEDTARLLAATPSLRASWLLAMAATLAFAAFAAASSASHDRGTLLFLIVAPILPVAGVAVAFHGGLDPAYEIGLATPYPQFRLLLLRSAAVTAVTCITAFAAGLLLPQRALTAAAWLLPALALTSLTLALGRRVDTAYAAGVVVAVWTAAVVLGYLRLGSFAVFGIAGQLTYLAVAVASLVVLAAGRNPYATRLGGV
ncbi:MAG TPA: hypothetical protein VGJ63_14875 [Micromonosporaceae bacterium]|jgi:hypothetical protein